MFLTRYRHRLPADYAMERIRDRIAARGPNWDTAPGLVFKAFTLENRERGAPANAYSSLYLWQDPRAAANFFAGPGFAAVVATFGRPRTESWLPFAIRLGAADTARRLVVSERVLAPEANLTAERHAEEQRAQATAAEPDVLAVLVGLDTLSWRLTRFDLRSDEAGPSEILHLAAPGLSALRAMNQSRG